MLRRWKKAIQGQGQAPELEQVLAQVLVQVLVQVLAQELEQQQ